MRPMKREVCCEIAARTSMQTEDRQDQGGEAWRKMQEIQHRIDRPGLPDVGIGSR